MLHHTTVGNFPSQLFRTEARSQEMSALAQAKGLLAAPAQATIPVAATVVAAPAAA